MTPRIVRAAWCFGLVLSASLAGTGAYSAATAEPKQARQAPIPQTAEPPLAVPIRVAPVSQSVNLPSIPSITLPVPTENLLRPAPSSLTFNSWANPPEAAPQPHTPKPAPGDAPVNMTKQAVLTALIGGALAAGPGTSQGPAGAGDANKPVDVKVELGELKKQVNEMKAAQKQIADVILGKNEGKAPEDAGLVKRLDTMAEAIRKLDEKLTRIGEQVAATQRVAGSSPINNPPPVRGTVRLVNNYFTDVSIIVNGVSYLLAPTQTKDVAVAPGEFGYALPQSGGIETRSQIKNGETVTLRIK